MTNSTILAEWVSVEERLPDRWETVLVWPRPTDYCCEAHHTGREWGLV